MSLSIKTIYIQSVVKRFKYYKELADKTFEQLEEKDFNFQPDSESNSIGVIIRHMSGNMISRWTNFLTEDGEKSWRKRDDEFAVQYFTKQQLFEEWENGWKVMLDVLERLTEDDLVKTIYIRHEPHIVIDAINRQLSHYPYHVGQIVYIGKMIKRASWKSLSIEKGKSLNFNEVMKQSIING
jgi:hypothetical protein